MICLRVPRISVIGPVPSLPGKTNLSFKGAPLLNRVRNIVWSIFAIGTTKSLRFLTPWNRDNGSSDLTASPGMTIIRLSKSIQAHSIDMSSEALRPVSNDSTIRWRTVSLVAFACRASYWETVRAKLPISLFKLSRRPYLLGMVYRRSLLTIVVVGLSSRAEVPIAHLHNLMSLRKALSVAEG